MHEGNTSEHMRCAYHLNPVEVGSFHRLVFLNKLRVLHELFRVELILGNLNELVRACRLEDGCPPLHEGLRHPCVLSVNHLLAKNERGVQMCKNLIKRRGVTLCVL